MFYVTWIFQLWNIMTFCTICDCSRYVYLITAFMWTIYFLCITFLTDVFYKLLTFHIVFKNNSVSNSWTMDAAISEALLEQVMLSFKWINKLNYDANDDSPSINLAKVVGSLPQIQMNALDQPENHLFLNGSCFRLLSEYYGLEAPPQVKSFLIAFVMVLGYHWHEACITWRVANVWILFAVVEYWTRMPRMFPLQMVQIPKMAQNVRL